MSAVPFWFGPADRPLFGWLHRPESGVARGGVVLCPPVGIEAICTYFTYRQIAERLAENGLVGLRFDYDGTGDSFGGPDDPDRVASWQRSTAAAVEVLHEAGIERVGLLGMRVGALLAASEAERLGGVDAAVLWDPCLSGRAFLRDQKAFRALSLGGEIVDDGTVESPGLLFDAETVADLGSLDLTKGPRLAEHVLVVEDRSRPHSSRLASRLSNSETEWIEAVGQGALLDPPRQETPWECVDEVSRWLARRFDSAAQRPIAAPTEQSRVLGETGTGQPIVERVVWLGPQRLFGLLTESETVSEAPTIVFVNEGSTPHIGQSRMWVELARDWAKSGLRVLRFDLSGNGDSEVRPGGEQHVTRTLESFADVADAVTAISPADPSNVVLVGLCAGAYQAVEAALTMKLRGICLVNPIFTFPYPEPVLDLRRRARQSTRAWFVGLAGAPTRWVARRQKRPDPDRWSQSLEIANWPTAIARRHRWIPEVFWRFVRRIALTQTSAEVIDAVVNRGIAVMIVVCDEDLFPITLGARHIFARLARSPLFELNTPVGLDHAGLIVEQRRRVMHALTGHILSSFAPVNAGAVTSDLSGSR